MMKNINFTKMHGAGNDYIYVNTMEHPIACPSQCAIAWSDRHKGIGADGLVLIGESDVADFSMRIFNADGSEAKMCGNACRCIGKYVYDRRLTNKTEITLHTLSGIKTLSLHIGADNMVESVTVGMGVPNQCQPVTLSQEFVSLLNAKAHFVDMGNPHLVVFVENVKETDPHILGPTLEKLHGGENGINVEFVEVMPDSSLRMRVWERGSGVTLACGTGACATAVAAMAEGLATHSVTVRMDGGDVRIDCDERSGHISMTGDATIVFDGEVTQTFPIRTFDLWRKNVIFAKL